MRYKLAIFDLDGTILNTLEDLADATNYVMDRLGMPKRTIEEVRRFVGNGIHRLLELAVVEGTTDEGVDRAFDIFNEYYREHCADKTQPYDGIMDVLKALRENGVLTAVVSNKADYGVQSLCEDYFPGMFDFAVGEKQGIRRKPYPDSVLAVLNRFGVEKKDAVYIGDSEVDFATAKNAGLDVLMVGWGFRSAESLMELGAEKIMEKPAQILDQIL
ncbi:MAG: HAD-IA family hydrolase [Eubacteriales bacterium]|nr:HAD-IA family hydrolase [Eubacteriales bacterium]